MKDPFLVKNKGCYIKRGAILLICIMTIGSLTFKSEISPKVSAETTIEYLSELNDISAGIWEDITAANINDYSTANGNFAKSKVSLGNNVNDCLDNVGNPSFSHYFVNAKGGDRFNIVKIRSYSTICPILGTDSSGTIVWYDAEMIGKPSISNYEFTVPDNMGIERIYFAARSKSAPDSNYFNVQKYYEGDIHSYLQSEYNETLTKLQEFNAKGMTSFVFFSDLHYSAAGSGYFENDLRSPVFGMISVIEKLTREFPLACVVAGGDYMQMPTVAAGMTKQMGIDNISDINFAMSKIEAPKIAIAGNHEAGYRSGSVNKGNKGTDYGLTDDEIYEFLGKNYITDKIRQASQYVFYYIDDESEILWLFMSDTIEPQTYLQTGIDAALAANTNGYPVVAFHHFAVKHKNADDINPTIYSGVKETIDYILDKDVELIAWIGGHCHSDWVLVYNEIPIISCLQSGYWSPAVSQDGVKYDHNGKLNTKDESAFSIFTIDKSKGKLYCTRFGLGKDREINYNKTSGEVGIVEWINMPTIEPTIEPTSKPQETVSVENGIIYINSDKSVSAYVVGYDSYGRLEYVSKIEAPAGKTVETKQPDSVKVSVMLWEDNKPSAKTVSSAFGYLRTRIQCLPETVMTNSRKDLYSFNNKRRHLSASLPLFTARIRQYYIIPQILEFLL